MLIVLIALIVISMFSVTSFAFDKKEETLEDFLTKYDYCLDITSIAWI